jgi:hypothetical protein
MKDASKFSSAFHRSNTPWVCLFLLGFCSKGAERRSDDETLLTCDLGLLVLQIQPQISLCKKKILYHIKISAYIWSTKCR